MHFRILRNYYFIHIRTRVAISGDQSLDQSSRIANTWRFGVACNFNNKVWEYFVMHLRHERYLRYVHAGNASALLYTWNLKLRSAR